MVAKGCDLPIVAWIETPVKGCRAAGEAHPCTGGPVASAVMRILVLGGTAFVGRAIVEDALRSGAEVTLCSPARALAAGMPATPLAVTAADVLAWGFSPRRSRRCWPGGTVGGTARSCDYEWPARPGRTAARGGDPRISCAGYASRNGPALTKPSVPRAT